MVKRSWLIGTVSGLFILIVTIGTVGYLVSRPTNNSGQSTGSIISSIKIGGPFTLLAHTGETVSDADFHGKYMLVYFGYTFCPDVCPTALQEVANTIDELGPDAAAVQPLFITVDPQRDTAKVLAEYVDAFHPRLIGLTGTSEQIIQVAKAYRTYYAKVETTEADEFYLMDHSSLTYLMGRDGEYLTVFSHNTPSRKMAAAIKEIINNHPKP